MGLENTYTNITGDNYQTEYHKQNLAGHVHIRKFFENPNFGTDIADAWDQGGIISYTNANGADYYIASSNNSDVQNVKIGMLDKNYVLYDISIQINGQTPVQIGDGSIKWLRAFRISNNDSTDFAGTISLIEGNAFTDGVPDTLTDIRAVVKPGNNQTLMCHFTIPAGYYAIFDDQLELSCLKKQAALVNASLFIREEGKVFRIRDRIGLITTGNSNINKTITTTTPIPPKSDIKITVVSDTTGMAMTGSYELVLIREDLVKKWNAFDTDNELNFQRLIL